MCEQQRSNFNSNYRENQRKVIMARASLAGSWRIRDLCSLSLFCFSKTCFEIKLLRTTFSPFPPPMSSLTGYAFSSLYFDKIPRGKESTLLIKQKSIAPFPKYFSSSSKWSLALKLL